MNIVYLDSETTGLDEVENDIVTLAGIIEIDGVVKEEFDYKLRPFNPDNIEPEAMKINGFTKEEVMAFPPAIEAITDLENRLSKYVNRFKKAKTMEEKFVPAGQNVDFDIRFLSNTYKKAGNNYFFSMIDYHKLDLVGFSMWLKIKGFIDIPNIKLETMAKYFDVPIVAHNAMSDIQATREIILKILERLDFKPETAMCPVAIATDEPDQAKDGSIETCEKTEVKDNE